MIELLLFFTFIFWVPHPGSGSKWRKVEIRIRIIIDADPKHFKGGGNCFSLKLLLGGTSILHTHYSVVKRKIYNNFGS